MHGHKELARLAVAIAEQFADQAVLTPRMNTLTRQPSIESSELEARMDSVALKVANAPLSELHNSLIFLRDAAIDPIELAAIAEPKSFEKHHGFLTDSLLSADYASSVVDVEEAKLASIDLIG
ncbi:MAG: hypothetical protein HYX29_07315 [Solirubrobacterales bacterium]|nr:hypothetical protein [Solirubrobacterales bacterium]